MTTAAPITPQDVLRTLGQYRNRILVAVVAMTVVAGVFAVVRPRTWEASQTLVVRQRAAANNGDALGRFRDLDEMKVTQETMLELAKSESVLRQALAEVGPANGKQVAEYPSGEDIDDLRDQLKLAAPNGAEFGKTEILHLKVKDRNRQRAIALAAAVCDQLQDALQHVQHDRASSMIAELDKAQQMANSELATATDKITAIESQVGADLAELRMLNLSGNSDSDLRRRLNELENERRQAENALAANQELVELLTAAQSDQGRLLATPNRLLESQPALRRLKEGLVDAQIRTATLLGKMTAQHPEVMDAKAAEIEISQHLHDELATAIRGVNVELELTQDRIGRLTSQRDNIMERLSRLASLRAEYSNVVSEGQHRTNLAERARKDLADARATLAASENASLVTPVDRPTTGPYRNGPSSKMIILAGLFGGLVLGIGWVALTADFNVHGNVQHNAESIRRDIPVTQLADLPVEDEVSLLSPANS